MSIYSDAVLILKPSGYKAAELYSVVPNTSVGDFDVARSSTTTRRNASGYIEQVAANVPRLNYDSGDSCPYLLTEAASTNLITYPKSFGNSYWTKSGASIEGDSSTAGSELIPNDIGRNFGTNVTTEGTPYTNFNAAYNAVEMYVYSNPTDIGVSSNVLSITSTGSTQGIVWKNSHIPITSGNMYKFTMNVTSITGSWKLSFYDRDSGFWGNNIIFTTTGLKTLYVQAQSTNIEFQLLSVSAGSISVDASTINNSVKQVTGFEAPKVDGSGGFEKEAYKLVEDGTTSQHNMIQAANVTIVGATIYTESIYAKAGENDKIGLRESAETGKYAAFDLSDGTVIETNGISASITPMANSWYRIDYQSTSSGTDWKIGVFLLPDSYTTGNVNQIYLGTSGNGVYIAYAQLEESDYASSLMLPTTEGSTTSRVGDSIENAGNQSLFSGVNSSGVLYAEIAANSDDLTSRYISISDGTNDNRVNIYYRNVSDGIYYYIGVGGVKSAGSGYSVTDITDFHKVAVRWAVNDFSLWVDGVEVATDTSGSVYSANTLTELAFDAGSGGSDFYGKTKAVAVFDYLSDAEMVTLTT
jgi:hypothetical protein